MTRRSKSLARLSLHFVTSALTVSMILQFPKTVTCATNKVKTRSNVSATSVTETFWHNLKRFESLEWANDSFLSTVQDDEMSATDSDYPLWQERLSNLTVATDEESEQVVGGNILSSKNQSSTSLLTRDTTNCECGLKLGGTGKIVGGSLAEDRAWPWLAGLIYVGEQKPKLFCGGSLINNLYILTAAHCVVDMQSVGYQNFRIYLGTNLISGSSTNVTQVRISNVISHPNYNPKTLNSDIALIRMATIVPFSERVQPICLGQNGAPYIGSRATVAGWGALSAATYPVNALRNVNVQVIENPKCATNYAKVKIRITPVMICASLPKKDSCKGDSGGPLFTKRNKGVVFDQIGVVSFGQDCAKPDFPGVYTRVGRFIPWIKENTLDATYCTRSFTTKGHNNS